LRNLRETQASLIEAEKLAALGSLVAGVAHEINTPVGNCLTVASSLERKVEAFALQVARGDIRRSALNQFVGLAREASAQLVSNLIRAAELVHTFKQVVTDQHSSERRAFDVGELTQQVLVGLGRELRNRNIRLSLECEADLVMRSYPGAYGQLLNNLILNSIIHGFPGRSEGEIDLRLRAFGADFVEIVVSDNGQGMSSEVKRQAFDPFFTTRRNHGSTGLGLHIVHSIVVDRLGGRLALESEPGVGTKVLCMLPRSSP
jgi:signal transduction histidine kinase